MDDIYKLSVEPNNLANIMVDVCKKYNLLLLKVVDKLLTFLTAVSKNS